MQGFVGCPTMIKAAFIRPSRAEFQVVAVAMPASPGGHRVVIFIFWPRDNPVKYTDPDGKADVKPTTRMGQRAHLFFETTLYSSLASEINHEDLLSFYDRTLRTIVREINKEITGDPSILAQQAPDVDELANPRHRPDVVTFIHIQNEIHVEVYKLKPIPSTTGYKHEAAKTQINGYITDLRNIKLPYVRGGDRLITGIPFPFPESGSKATIVFTADPDIKGLYYYAIDDGMSK
jgi:hypothetical protein